MEVYFAGDISGEAIIYKHGVKPLNDYMEYNKCFGILFSYYWLNIHRRQQEIIKLFIKAKARK